MSGHVTARGLCGRQCCMVYSAVLSATAKNRLNLMSDEDENSYCIGHHVGKQGPRHPAGDQAGVEKLAIGTETDSHGNDRKLNKGNSNQIIGVGIPPKETTATTKQKDLLVEVKTNTFYGLRKITKKVKKFGQVKIQALHQQMKTLTYFVKYEKKENEVQALIDLTNEEGMAEVIAVEKKNVNMGNSITMDHYFREEKKQETTKRRKTP